MCISLAPGTVQTDAHTASKEEEQTQAQTPSTAGPITTRYRIQKLNRNGSFQSANLNLSHLKETPSDTDPKKKKKKRDDDPDRKKKKKDKKKKKVRQPINNCSVVFLRAELSSMQSYEAICDL